MPNAPLRICSKPSCPGLYDSTTKTCSVCSIKNNNQGSEYRKLYGWQWQQARLIWLSSHPWCEECLGKDKRTPATLIHHVVAHRGSYELFWDQSNWQSLCSDCHHVLTGKGL